MILLNKALREIHLRKNPIKGGIPAKDRIATLTPIIEWEENWRKSLLIFSARIFSNNTENRTEYRAK